MITVGSTYKAGEKKTERERRWVKIMLEMEKSSEEKCWSGMKSCRSSDADRRLNYFCHRKFEELAADRAESVLVSGMASVSPEPLF